MPSFLGIWPDLELKFTFNFRSTLHLTFSEKSTTVWLIEGKITPGAEERSSCWKRLTRQNLPSYGQRTMMNDSLPHSSVHYAELRQSWGSGERGCADLWESRRGREQSWDGSPLEEGGVEETSWHSYRFLLPHQRRRQQLVAGHRAQCSNNHGNHIVRLLNENQNSGNILLILQTLPIHDNVIGGNLVSSNRKSPLRPPVKNFAFYLVNQFTKKEFKFWLPATA